MAGTAALTRRARLLALLFCVYASIAILLISLLMPPFQAADEFAHYLRADEIAGGGLVATRYAGRATSGGTVDLGIGAVAELFDPLKFHPERKTTRQVETRAEAIAWGPRGLLSFPNTAIYPPFFYLPSAIGVAIGHAAGWTVVHALLLSRLLNGASCLMVGTLAIAVAGELAPLLFTILCLPMSLALFASVSQDGLMIASSALATSLLARAAHGVGRRRILSFGIACLALALVGMARPAYLPLMALPLLLCCLPWRTRIRAAVASAAAVVGWTLLADRVTLLGASSDQVAQQLRAIAAHPGIWSSVVWNTVALQLEQGGPYYREFVGVLGWLDTTLPNSYHAVTLAVLLLSVVASLPRQAPALSRRRRWLAIGLLIAATLSVFVLQYLSWTPIGGRIVEGVQGRYFLPIALFVPLALPALHRGVSHRAIRAMLMPLMLYPALSLAVAIRAIVLRYYF